MFADIRLDVLERIQATRSFLRANCRLRTRQFVLEAKGLAFVQMYAIWEETVRSIVKAALLQVKAMARPMDKIRLELLSLLLEDQIKAVVATHETKNQWDRRIKLFLQISSSGTATISEGIFPSDGSQFRAVQIETIWSIFGITCPALPHAKHKLQINELVENRNAIAHGREPPAEVGRRYSVREISKRISATKRVCLHVISSMENHCSTHTNLCR